MARFRRRAGAAGATAGRAVGRLGAALASLATLITSLIALVIALGIAFYVLKANPHNSIVSSVHDVAKFFVGPIDGIFTPKDKRLALAINWGIAIIVWLLIGRVLARVLRTLDRLG